MTRLIWRLFVWLLAAAAIAAYVAFHHWLFFGISKDFGTGLVCGQFLMLFLLWAVCKPMRYRWDHDGEIIEPVARSSAVDSQASPAAQEHLSMQQLELKIKELAANCD